MSNLMIGSKYDTATMKAMLNEAQEAYHNLMIGEKAVKIARNGRDVEFTQTNKNDLAIYIQSLQKQLKLVSGRSAPSGVMFS